MKIKLVRLKTQIIPDFNNMVVNREQVFECPSNIAKSLLQTGIYEKAEKGDK